MAPHNPNSVPADVTNPVSATDAVADRDPASDLPDLLKKAEAEVAELREAWLRARADADNARKQAQADVARAYK
jgi:molecular chaperone GrpE